MKNSYYLYDVEMSSSYQKRMLPLWEGSNLYRGLDELGRLIRVYGNGAKHFQLIEREHTGILFVRVDVRMDGRPFCNKPEELGPDSFGYYNNF